MLLRTRVQFWSHACRVWWAHACTPTKVGWPQGAVGWTFLGAARRLVMWRLCRFGLMCADDVMHPCHYPAMCGRQAWDCWWGGNGGVSCWTAVCLAAVMGTRCVRWGCVNRYVLNRVTARTFTCLTCLRNSRGLHKRYKPAAMLLKQHGFWEQEVTSSNAQHGCRSSWVHCLPTVTATHYLAGLL
jgi:hypothetical protein